MFGVVILSVVNGFTEIKSEIKRHLREHLISSQFFFFLNLTHFEMGVGVALILDGKS